MKKSYVKKLTFLCLAILTLSTYLCIENNWITITKVDYQNENLPKSFQGYKILQISDLHNKEFGKGQSKLYSKIETINPDIIFITGDLIDSNHTNMNAALRLIDKITKIAPIYYVSGNHEAWSGHYTELTTELENRNVTVLENLKTELSIGNDHIELIGISDPSFQKMDWFENDTASTTEDQLSILTEDASKFTILLSHRPELFDLYSKCNIDLVFSGHAHGGQIRLPFIGGLIAPDQGLLPKLTAGMHTKNSTSMIISRGLGNSVLPFRIFNRPELVVVTLSN